ncbi:MAG TPA: hypothetical protein DCX95_01500, partial [Elusimicrobia bacterium]|nr:hypothetical protein [Elusimicrobiota bacterium]
MKKILLLGLIVGMSAFLCAAGLRLGMTGAVKEKVKELDKKVREKKAETTVQPPATQTLQTLSGTAAKGAAIASKAVVAKSTEGYTATGTTDATGKFTVDITSMSLPVLLKVTDGTATYFSVANASGTCNIHPFTDMVVRTYFKSTKNVSDVKDAFDNNFVSLGTLPAKETIDTIKSVVATVVSSVLERNGIDPLSYDMFTTPFDANSSGFDKALEQTQITFGSDYSYSVIKDTTTGIVISTVAPTANDITAPDAPTNVAATGISGTSIKLSWTASPGTDIAGYAIYRDGVKIANVSYTTYLDVGLPAGVPGGIQYGYTIEAYDWAGKKSAKTTAVSCATLTEFAITATGKFDGVPATAFDGTNYLMAYGIRDSTNAPYNLEATFVLGSGSAGTLLSFDVLGSTHGGGIDVASIAYGSTSNKYLMVFRSTETCNWPTVGTNYGNLYGIFITPAGVKSSPVLISTAPSAGRPAIASDGTNYLITWSDFRNTGDNRDIYGRMIAPDGSLIGSEIAIATAPYTQGQTELRYTGSKYLATWSDGRRHALNPGTNNYNS